MLLKGENYCLKDFIRKHLWLYSEFFLIISYIYKSHNSYWERKTICLYFFITWFSGVIEWDKVKKTRNRKSQKYPLQKSGALSSLCPPALSEQYTILLPWNLQFLLRFMFQSSTAEIPCSTHDLLCCGAQGREV